MRILALIVTVAMGSFWMASAVAQNKEDPANQPKVQKPADKVKQLHQERIATLKAMAEVETRLHQIGQATPEAMLEARVLVGEAELAAAETQSERITVLKSLIEVLKECEAAAKARKLAAEGTETPVLKAKARRLAAEILLEQTQQPDQAQTRAEPKRDPVIVTSVQAKDALIDEQFICTIHSRRHIDIRSQQRGYLEEIQVKEGQSVKQGDVLFKITPKLYQAKLEAELAEVELATLNLKNTQKLFENKVVNEMEVALLRAKLASAQAKAKLAQAELELTMVRAPFDGIIDRFQQQQGSLVTERDILTTLSDNRVMWVNFQVPQSYYLEHISIPATDQEIEVELVLSGGRKFAHSGSIAAIEGQFDRETGTIPFRADFPNPEGLLRHGMTGTLSVHRKLTSALVIPQQATFEILGKWYVYVVDKKDMAHQREVVVSCELSHGYVIQKGLDANDRIVVEGVQQVHDGEKLEYEFRKP